MVQKLELALSTATLVAFSTSSFPKATGEFITSLGFLLQEMGQRKFTPRIET